MCVHMYSIINSIVKIYKLSCFYFTSWWPHCTKVLKFGLTLEKGRTERQSNYGQSFSSPSFIVIIFSLSGHRCRVVTGARDVQKISGFLCFIESWCVPFVLGTSSVLKESVASGAT